MKHGIALPPVDIGVDRYDDVLCRRGMVHNGSD
jgi:hypothetical protein